MSSQSNHVVLARDAADDLDSIILFSLATWDIATAKHYLDLIVKAFASIAQGPGTCSLKDDVPGDVYTYDLGHHTIYFRLQDEVVQVLRLLHWELGATHHLDP